MNQLVKRKEKRADKCRDLCSESRGLLYRMSEEKAFTG